MDVDAKHPYWVEHAEYWEQIDLLQLGGMALKKQAARFLVARPAEAAKVYQTRLQRFTYQNILGTVIGWYESRMFRDDPQIFVKNADGSQSTDKFYGRFLANADRRGTTLTSMAREWFRRCLLDGAVYVLTDLPGDAGEAANRQEQREMGRLDPYLATFPASQVINWSEDAQGNLEWIVLATSERRQEFGAKPEFIDTWWYFDRENFRQYQARRDGAGKARTPEVVSEGRHAMADRGRVPVRRISVPPVLWIGYRVLPQVVDHLNADNALSWALFMSCLAVPVIAGTYHDNPQISETGWILLEKGSTFGWSEPTGSSYEHASKRVDSLREEVYRQAYLQAQGRSTQATAAAQSGVSKQLDMTPSTDVMNGYGRILREALKGVLEDVVSVRGDDLVVDVSGMSFPEREVLAEIEVARAALDLDIPSDTYDRLVKKTAYRQYVNNADPDTLRQIDLEIDAAPGRAERAAEERERRRQDFAAALGRST
ncbi:MAG: hypothetical protein K2X35_09585 [Bryobacteraceae bacterium]|nr:hypothetical protein [Bryobacteraceae bacterium]